MVVRNITPYRKEDNLITRRLVVGYCSLPSISSLYSYTYNVLESPNCIGFSSFLRRNRYTTPKYFVQEWNTH